MPLVIRQAQMDVFAQQARELFIDDMAVHVARYFPGRRAQLGVGLHRAISDAIIKAKKYGLTRKRDVCKFINVTMTLGPDFEQHLPMMHDILTSAEPPCAKARHLSAVSMAIHQAVKHRQQRDGL